MAEFLFVIVYFTSPSEVYAGTHVFEESTTAPVWVPKKLWRAYCTKELFLFDVTFDGVPKVKLYKDYTAGRRPSFKRFMPKVAELTEEEETFAVEYNML